MQVREVIETLGLKLMTHEVPVDVDVIGGYASDRSLVRPGSKMVKNMCWSWDAM